MRELGTNNRLKAREEVIRNISIQADVCRVPAPRRNTIRISNKRKGWVWLLTLNKLRKIKYISSSLIKSLLSTVLINNGSIRTPL